MASRIDGSCALAGWAMTPTTAASRPRGTSPFATGGAASRGATDLQGWERARDGRRFGGGTWIARYEFATTTMEAVIDTGSTSTERPVAFESIREALGLDPSFMM